MNYPKRKPMRLKNYDYSQNGAYFITICTKDRQPLLCKIVGCDDLGVPQKYNEYDNPRTAQSFMVDKNEIAANDYDLSINKYKEIEYTSVEYPPTSEIIKELKDMEDEIQKDLAELEEML